MRFMRSKIHISVVSKLHDFSKTVTVVVTD